MTMFEASEPDVPDDDVADTERNDEQDLLVVLRLSNRQMGLHEERAGIEALADELADAVAAAGVGEFDGDEVGGGQCTLFFCGTDVDRMIAVLRPLLRRSTHARGGAFVRLGADGGQERIPV